MIIAGILLLLLGAIGSIIGTSISKDRENTGFVIVCMCSFLAGILLIIATNIQRIEKHSRDNHVKIEINVTYKDGIETSRDTVYYFTRKK